MHPLSEQAQDLELTFAQLGRTLGWLAGRTWLILAFFAETVVYGFREGAGLPQPSVKTPPEGT